MTYEHHSLRIGELADAVGVSPKTIRFYEEFGVLPEPDRTTQGWRTYDRGDVERLRFVRGARAVGLGLDEIRQVLAHVDRGEPPCRQVLELLVQQMETVERRIAELQVLRADLEQLYQEGRRRPLDRDDMSDCVCQLVRARADGAQERSSESPA